MAKIKFRSLIAFFSLEKGMAPLQMSKNLIKLYSFYCGDILSINFAHHHNITHSFYQDDILFTNFSYHHNIIWHVPWLNAVTSIELTLKLLHLAKELLISWYITIHHQELIQFKSAKNTKLRRLNSGVDLVGARSPKACESGTLPWRCRVPFAR